MSIHSLEAEREIRIWNPAFVYGLSGRDLSVTEQGETRRGPITLATRQLIEPIRAAELLFYVDWVALQTPDGNFLEDESRDWPGILALNLNTENIRTSISEDGTIVFRNAKIYPRAENISKPRFRIISRPLYAIERQEDW